MDRTRLVWMKGHDYVNIQPHKLEVLDKHGILKIKNTTYSDSAIYTCVCKYTTRLCITILNIYKVTVFVLSHETNNANLVKSMLTCIAISSISISVY